MESLANILSNKNVLVLGGAGYIGSHVVSYLLKNNHVRIFDNFSNSAMDYAFFKDLVNKRNKNAVTKSEIVVGDIRDKSDIKEALKGVDFVINFAKLTGSVFSDEEPKAFYDVNVKGTQNLMEEIVKNEHIFKFINASSSCVYGSSFFPVKETDNLNPLSWYAETEKIAEDIVNWYSKEVITVNLRLFNVFGIEQKSKSVVYKILQSIINREPVYINWDGNQIRDFIYIKDVTDAFYQAILYGQTGKTYNINNEVCSINNLFTKIRNLVNPKFDNFIYLEPKEDENYGFAGDNSLAQKDLLFQPRFSLDEALLDTIQRT